MTTLGAHPARLDLYVHPGDPIDFSVPVLDAAGAVVSLSGWAATAQVLDTAGTVLHDFGATIASDQIRVAATPTATGAWAWNTYAARLVVTATPPLGAPTKTLLGWIRLYRP